MKKLFVFILIAILSLSTALLSACEEEAAIEEEISISSTTSKSKLSRGEISAESVSTSNSTEDDDSSDDYDDSDEIDASFGASGDDYIVQQIDTTNLSTNAKTVANLINTLGTITAYNFEKKGSTISYAKDAYSKLTSSEKAEVSNYESLLGAEQAYNAFVKSVSDQAIIELKTKIELIRSFQVNEAFETAVEEARAIYLTIGDQYKANVNAEYTTLVAGEFAVSCSQLPDSADGLRLSHVDQLNNLTKTLTENAAISSQNGFAPFMTKYNMLHQKLLSATVESTMIANDTDNDGIISPTEMTANKTTSHTTSRDGVIVFGSVGGSEAKGDKAFPYTDKLNQGAGIVVNRIMKGNFTLNAKCAGVLKLYVQGNDKTYVVNQGSDIIFESPKISSGSKQMIEIEITTAGTYSIHAAKEGNATVNEESRLYVASFSYPDLPA